MPPPRCSALDRFLEFRYEFQQGFVLIVDFLYAEGILVFPHHFSTSLARRAITPIAAKAIRIGSDSFNKKSSLGPGKLPMS
jgi:hypothetical protein